MTKDDPSSSLAQRGKWTLSLFRPRHESIYFDASLDAVTKSIIETIQWDFPSPPGVPVIGGRVSGENPVRISLRPFPQGARYGMTFRRDRGDWLRPFLFGKLEERGGRTLFSYKISSFGGVYIFPIFLLVATGLLCASIVLFSSGSTSVGLALLLISILFAAGTVLYALNVQQEMANENLLRAWLQSLVLRVSKTA